MEVEILELRWTEDSTFTEPRWESTRLNDNKTQYGSENFYTSNIYTLMCH